MDHPSAFRKVIHLLFYIKLSFKTKTTIRRRTDGSEVNTTVLLFQFHFTMRRSKEDTWDFIFVTSSNLKQQVNFAQKLVAKKS